MQQVQPMCARGNAVCTLQIGVFCLLTISCLRLLLLLLLLQSAAPVRRRTPLNLYVTNMRSTPDDRSAALIRMLEELKEEYPEQVAATARAAAHIAGARGRAQGYGRGGACTHRRAVCTWRHVCVGRGTVVCLAIHLR